MAVEDARRIGPGMEGAAIGGNGQNQTTIERFTLDNGVRVITEEIPWVASVSLGFYISVGSVYETKHLSGISHFLEHMVFKGTRTRSPRDIVMEIESVGGVINAGTGKELTQFYVRIYHAHMDKAVDILTDLVFKPLFDSEELEKEKGVVLEEVRMGEDNPDEYLVDSFHDKVYGDTPLGRKIVGNREAIISLTRRQLIEYHTNYYNPANLTVSAAGRVSAQKLGKMLESSFRKAGLWRRKNFSKPRKPRFKARFRPARFLITRDVEQTTLMVGCPSVAILDPERYTFSLIDAYLSGGMSSRFFQEVREKRGLVYTIDSTQAPLSKAGLYTIDAGMIGGNAAEVAAIIAKELSRVASKGVPVRSLKNAREYMKGIMLLALESSTARMSRNAMNEIYFHRSVPISELIGTLDRVKSEDTRELAQRIFDPANLAVGILTSNSRKGKTDGLLDRVCREFKLS